MDRNQRDGGNTSAQQAQSIKFCIFCKKNGERPEVYTSHTVKDSSGRVKCSVLRNYVCPTCHSTGDNAHTLRHCPEKGSYKSPTENHSSTSSSGLPKKKK